MDKRKKMKSKYYNFGDWFKCWKTRRQVHKELDSGYDTNQRKPYYSFGLWFKCRANYAVFYRQNRCSIRRKMEIEHTRNYHKKRKKSIK